MDIYTLDSQLRRIGIIESYTSFIWTERWQASGDFTLSFPRESVVLNNLTVGTMLAIPRSHRIMIVDSVTSGVADDGTETTKVSGKSLEHVLSKRGYYVNGPSGNPVAAAVINKKPVPTIHDIFDKRCRNGGAADAIPFLKPANYLPLGNIPLIDDVISTEVEFTSVYDNISKICKTFGLGFRLIRDGDPGDVEGITTPSLYFEVYQGFDRSTQQTEFPAVVFDVDLDNLTDTEEVMSVTDEVNVVYLFHEEASQTVFREIAGAQPQKWERKVATISYTPPQTDDELTKAQLLALMTQSGREFLADHRPVRGFSGRVSHNSNYTYGVDYNVGDLVEVRNGVGLSTVKRVNEQIFASDAEGDRYYPTLVDDYVIDEGAWYHWSANVNWDNATGTWNTWGS